jgi:HK97 family phage portal protein
MIESLNTLAPLGIFRAADRRAPPDPGDDFWYRPVGWQGDSAMPVTPLTALQISAVYACHRILSGDIAKTPIGVFRRTKEGREVAEGHYLERLLTKQANPYMSARRFKALMQNWALSDGNAYAQLDINTRGQITALWPWRPDRVTVKTAPNWDGYLYEYALKTGEKVVQPWTNILHIRGLEVDGVLGLNPIECSRRTMDLALSSEEHGRNFYKNGARMGGILSGNFGGADKAQIREEFDSVFGGVGNHWKTAVFKEGTTYTPLSIRMVDAEYIATRKMGIADISRIYGVPLHKLAELDKATFSNIEEQNLDYVASSFGDWAANWESEIAFSCLSERESNSILVEFDVDHLVRGRLGEQMAAYGTAVDKGLMTHNEARGKLHLNTKEGADRLLIQQQMIPVEDAKAPTEPTQGAQ